MTYFLTETPLEDRKTRYKFRVYTTFATTEDHEHTGQLAGVLIRARRLATETFRTWESGKGPYLCITDARTGLLVMEVRL
jgi:hypothetical protein